jgi:hypothetical protein
MGVESAPDVGAWRQFVAENSTSICRKIDNALDHPEHRDRADRMPAVAMRVRDVAQRDAAETRSAAGGSITTVYRRRSSS